MPRVSHPCAAADTPQSRLAESARRSMVRATQQANRRRARPRWAVPARKIALRLSPFLLLAGIVGVTFSNGTLPAAWQSVCNWYFDSTARAGMSVAEVYVIGRQEADRDEVLQAVGVQRGSPILAFDPHETQHRLEAIAWIASATVERRLPDTIIVRLTERVPMAIWQHEKALRLVDADGHVLSTERLDRWDRLMLLVGAEAPERAGELFTLMKAEPDLASRVEAATLINGRRWDLKLDNGVDIRLPELDAASALRRLAAVQKSGQLLERDVVAVDLRMPDRLAVQTSAAAAERRRAAAAVAALPPKKA
jgi:cell division protein FtsQ